MLVGHLALIAAALFTGAAFYVNFAEQPARLCLDDRSLLAEWKPAYKRGTSMQATLAIVGFLLGVLAWWLTGIHRWSDPDAGELAVDHVWSHADEREAHGDRTIRRGSPYTRSSHQVEQPSCRSDGVRWSRCCFSPVGLIGSLTDRKAFPFASGIPLGIMRGYTTPRQAAETPQNPGTGKRLGRVKPALTGDRSANPSYN
jgi:hypothetical protein